MNRRHWMRQSLLASGLLLPAGAALATRRPPSADPARLWAEHPLRVDCGELDALAPADTPAPVRLSANENPYGPSPAARAALAEAAASGHRYAYRAALELTAELAQREGVRPEQVLVGAGSKDLLALIALAWARPSAASPTPEVVAPHPTYNFLLSAAEGLGARWVQVPLDAQQRVDLEALARALTPATQLVYLCNPHNPTGTHLPGEQLLSFVREAARRAPVVVDEAYLEFVPERGYPSASQLIGQGHDVLVVRTFSKAHGMAGLRVGHVVGPAARIAQLSKLATVSAMNLAGPSVAAARASLADAAWVNAGIAQNAQVRQQTLAELAKLGIEPVASVTNFVAWPLPPARVAFKAAMLERGYQVNDFTQRGQTWARLSIGTEAEMRGLLAALGPWWRGA